jgi:hypothetical protein
MENLFPIHGLGCTRGRDTGNALAPDAVAKCEDASKSPQFGFRDSDDCCASGLFEEGRFNFAAAEEVAKYCAGEVKDSDGAAQPRWKILGFKDHVGLSGLTDCWVAHADSDCSDWKRKIDDQIKLRNTKPEYALWHKDHAKMVAAADFDAKMDEKRENGEWSKAELKVELDRLVAKVLTDVEAKVAVLKEKANLVGKADVRSIGPFKDEDSDKIKFQIVGTLYSPVGGIKHLGYQSWSVQTGQCPVGDSDKCELVNLVVDSYYFKKAVPKCCQKVKANMEGKEEEGTPGDLSDGKPSYSFPSLVNGEETFLYSLYDRYWQINAELGSTLSFDSIQSDADCPDGLTFKHGMTVECID